MQRVLSWVALLGAVTAVRRNSQGFFGRRRGPAAPLFDQNGCAGAACASLGSTEFDFVVVGSGAGGGTVAARLAEAGHSVLVLEAGVDPGEKYEYQMPIQHATSTETEGIAWNYYVQHYEDQTSANQDTKMTPRGILYPRGGALGGSTAVNAMINVLPAISDWERVAALTNDDGWSPSSMNKYEKLLDAWLPKDNIPLTNLVSKVTEPELRVGALARLLKHFDAAFDEMGQRNATLDGDDLDPKSKLGGYMEFLFTNVNDRLRKGNVEGAYAFPQMIKNGKRHGSRERLLQTVASGKLTIKTRALVEKVVFSNTNKDGTCNGPCRAKEVLYLDGQGLYKAEIKPSTQPTPSSSRVRVREGGEIILSAGAFNTPQILMQSGIGPRHELNKFNIPVHSDLEGVGQNLQDRYEVTVESKVISVDGRPLPFVNPEDCNYAADSSDMCFRHWASNGKGLYGINGAILSMLKRSGVTDASDLHIFGLPGPFRGYAPRYSDQIPMNDTRNIFSWVILKGHTDNRGGTVKLRCDKMVDYHCVADPRATPDINFRYFHEGTEYDELDPSFVSSHGERDLHGVVQAIKFVRRIMKKTNAKLSSSLSTRSLSVETWPGKSDFAPTESFGSDTERLREFVKREAWGHHASCTAPMGCLPSSEIGVHNAGAGECSGTTFNKKTVLDSRFRVRGTQGLRVMDASAFPRIPGTFLLLPTFMLGEKGAATIIEDHLCPGAFSTGRGECQCRPGLTCFNGDYPGCVDWSYSHTHELSSFAFLKGCTSCRCQ